MDVTVGKIFSREINNVIINDYFPTINADVVLNHVFPD